MLWKRNHLIVEVNLDELHSCECLRGEKKNKKKNPACSDVNPKTFPQLRQLWRLKVDVSSIMSSNDVNMMWGHDLTSHITKTAMRPTSFWHLNLFPVIWLSRQTVVQHHNRSLPQVLMGQRRQGSYKKCRGNSCRDIWSRYVFWRGF